MNYGFTSRTVLPDMVPEWLEHNEVYLNDTYTIRQGVSPPRVIYLSMLPRVIPQLVQRRNGDVAMERLKFKIYSIEPFSRQHNHPATSFAHMYRQILIQNNQPTPPLDWPVALR